MPQWKQPSISRNNSALSEVWLDLEREIQNMPPLEEVTGLSADELAAHAAEAVALFRRSTASSPSKALMQLYCLGFVVGMKYGERTMRSKE